MKISLIIIGILLFIGGGAILMYGWDMWHRTNISIALLVVAAIMFISGTFILYKSPGNV